MFQVSSFKDSWKKISSNICKPATNVTADIIEFIKAMKPGRILPVHTFKPEEFSRLFDNMVDAHDGNWMEV